MPECSGRVTVWGSRLLVTYVRDYQGLPQESQFHTCRYCRQRPAHRRVCTIRVIQMLDCRKRTLLAEPTNELYREALQAVNRQLGHAWVVCIDCQPQHDERDLR